MDENLDAGYVLAFSLKESTGTRGCMECTESKGSWSTTWDRAPTHCEECDEPIDGGSRTPTTSCATRAPIR
jgi:hypothetical protein